MAELTPMMRQYQDIKSQHQDKILFFRLGDFYEMFQDDARTASRLLGLTLTHRHTEPMCGIPYHSSQPYIRKLLEAGLSIAVCEQVSVPGAEKGIVRREVVDILTPGTLVEDGYLGSSASNYTLALYLDGDQASVAAGDLSTGELTSTSFRLEGRLDALDQERSRFNPKELLVSESAEELYPFLSGWLSQYPEMTVKRIAPWQFDTTAGTRRILEHFGVMSLQPFGLTSQSPEAAAVGVLLDYWQANSPGRGLNHVRELKTYRSGLYLQMDPQSVRSLELVANSRDGGVGLSLYGTLNKTVTAPGSRLLKQRLVFPLTNPVDIDQRLDRVACLANDPTVLKMVTRGLQNQLDVERLTARLALDKASPRDLLGLEVSVREALSLAASLSQVQPLLGPRSTWTSESRTLLLAWTNDSESLLERELPAGIGEGGLIRTGADPALDELRHVRDHSQEVLDAYLLEEQQLTGLSQLKLRYNKIIGYYFEVSKARLDQLPSHFQRKQSLVGSERFTTPRLRQIEDTLLHAQERIFETERRLFVEFRDRAKTLIPDFQTLAEWTADLDVTQCLAVVAVERRYVRPTFSSDSILQLVDARHPVVETVLTDGPFVPNTVDFLQGDILFLITGPNMAGKSTYLRQTALIVLLGQIGSFVPARDAVWKPVDKIFCRVGASDQLARGESTFLVEMHETAHILRNATRQSLVIMDEVGRGTSTRDGFSLAWAICEYLLDRIGARTLFATHFHELTALVHLGLKNFSMAVVEEGADVVFLRKVIEGAADHSYGLHVARLAGVPEAVVLRASEVLEELPAEGPRMPMSQPSTSQLDLFEQEDLLRRELRALDPNQMTPLMAINALAKLKGLL